MRRRNLLVDIFAATFGIGAWVAINGLWVELPLLVQELPEGWSLPSYLSVIIQIANIGPILYAVLRLLRPSVGPTPVIYIVLCIGCISSLFLSLFWDRTTMVGGVERSTALMSLVFFLALVDCTSSVLYIPYMASWRDIYLPSYLIGEGLSGLLPALVALGQGSGKETGCQNVSFINDNGTLSWYESSGSLDPNFSISVFFYIIFAMMVASSTAFITLEVLAPIQLERSSFSQISSFTTQNSLVSEYQSHPEKVQSTTIEMSNNTYGFLLSVQAWSSMLSNGFMPSIQSYSCGPYGNVTYHLAATMSALANPMAAFCTMIFPRAKPKQIVLLSLLCSIFTCYIIATAVMSPSPPLVGQDVGSVLIVLAWIAFTGVITYIRVEISNLMREEGAQALFWSGAVTQAGSAFGAIFAFMLVNKTNIFISYNPCE